MEGDICYVSKFSSLPANTALLERQKYLCAFETVGGVRDEESLAKMQRCDYCWSWHFLTRDDLLLQLFMVIYYEHYIAANCEDKLKPPYPLPTNLSRVAVSVRLMDKVPKRSYLQNKKVFCNTKKILLRNVFCLLWVPAVKGMVAQECSWVRTKQRTDYSGEVGGNVPAIWKSLSRVIMFS